MDPDQKPVDLDLHCFFKKRTNFILGSAGQGLTTKMKDSTGQVMVKISQMAKINEIEQKMSIDEDYESRLNRLMAFK